MIYVNSDIKNKIRLLNLDKLYIVSDFDRTLTLRNSDSSWAVLERNNFVCEEFSQKASDLYKYYFPVEFDLSIDSDIKNRLMHEWWSKVIELCVHYGLREDMVNDATSNIKLMQFRDGGKEFLASMNDNGVPVIIVSAGVGNFIEQFLRYNDSLYDNIHIVSNFIRFENGVATGIDGEIIHSCNKNTISLSDDIIGDREDILLLGDHIMDARMVPDDKRDHTIRVGFLDHDINRNLAAYRSAYDVVCTDGTSFHELVKTINF